MQRIVTIEANRADERIIENHIFGGNADYATMCGLDGDDVSDFCYQRTIATPIGAMVDCPECIKLWRRARQIPPHIVKGGDR